MILANFSKISGMFCDSLKQGTIIDNFIFFYLKTQNFCPKKLITVLIPVAIKNARKTKSEAIST